MHNFRKLAVWQKSKDIGNEIFALCTQVRDSKAKIIAAQLIRSALRISATIAEGCGKSTRGENIRYLNIAAGSAAETEHHLTVAMETGILPADRCAALLARTQQVSRIEKLIRKLPQD